MIAMKRHEANAGGAPEILRCSAGEDKDIFRQLSELDRLCVGAEGWSEESFRSEAEKENGFVLYILAEDRVAALLSGYCAAGEADITSVAAAPEHRRKGFAKALLKRFEELLPDDTESIFLEVRESNNAAISLYEKCGFEKLALRRNFYVQPRENAVVMQKKLKEG